MLIDWFTVGAQIVNFLVLVGLLRIFLYRRIVGAMEKREQNIADRLHEAEHVQQEAEDERRRYETKQAELESKGQELIKQAEEQAESRRKELIQEARSQVEQSRERWLHLLEEEQGTFLDELEREARDGLFSAAGRALNDIVDADLERQAIERFLDRLDRDENGIQRALSESLEQARDDTKTLTVTTSYEIPKDLRDRIKETTRKLSAGDGVAVTFETSPDLICGIELRTTGHKTEWSLRHYVDELRERVASTVHERTKESSAARDANR